MGLTTKGIEIGESPVEIVLRDGDGVPLDLEGEITVTCGNGCGERMTVINGRQGLVSPCSCRLARFHQALSDAPWIFYCGECGASGEQAEELKACPACFQPFEEC